MKKKLVFVVQVDVDSEEEEGLRQSFERWKVGACGAYAARMQVDEVKIQED